MLLGPIKESRKEKAAGLQLQVRAGPAAGSPAVAPRCKANGQLSSGGLREETRGGSYATSVPRPPEFAGVAKGTNSHTGMVRKRVRRSNLKKRIKNGNLRPPKSSELRPANATTCH